jgi:hypothetical protein
MGDVYKCPVDLPTATCEKLNLQSELYLATGFFTNSKISFVINSDNNNQNLIFVLRNADSFMSLFI